MRMPQKDLGRGTVPDDLVRATVPRVPKLLRSCRFNYSLRIQPVHESCSIKVGYVRSTATVDDTRHAVGCVSASELQARCLNVVDKFVYQIIGFGLGGSWSELCRYLDAKLRELTKTPFLAEASSQECQ